MRYAYVAQHAFHHVEQHLEKTPNEYIRWRFQTGEDKENLTKVTMQYTPEEEKLMKEKINVTKEDGTVMKLVVEKIISRRQKKNKYEYEVKWENLSMDQTTWMEKEKLEKCGFTKLIQRVDEREAARAGLYARPLTTANVEKHLIDFGLEAEFGTHNRIKGLSGGQKVKLVLGAAMWQQPHIVVMDEPTNYLDRDALGALACAVKEFGGGVLLITHNCEFADALKEETWDVPGTGEVIITGNRWGQGKKGKAEKTDWDGPQEDTIDAMGNTVKVKGPKKKLSRKDIKAKAKSRAIKLAAGQDLTTDSDWDLDVYIGEDPSKAKKAGKE
jgi:elongation factor 3